MRQFILLGSLALATPATAQTNAASPSPPARGERTTVYEPAFFRQYAPRTALDIVERVPGFQLDLGAAQNRDGQGSDIRGFAATAGNVVINGARPSSKAEALDSLLRRIPADRVTRVEVGPGNLFGSDYAGKPQVLNIILSEQSGLDANLTASTRRLYTGKLVPNGSASVSLTRGPSTYNLSAGAGHFLQFNRGPDTLTDLDSGAVIERRFKKNYYFNNNPYVSGSWALERSSDTAMRLNFRWQPSRFRLLQENRAMPVGGSPHDDELVQKYRTPVIELGGDVTRPLAGGALKLVGLATRRKRDNYDAYLGRKGLEEDGSPISSGVEQFQKARRNETIGRLSWTRGELAGFSAEAGLEGALNTLDSKLNVFGILNDGSRFAIDLPITDAKVTERRGEAYVRLGRNVSPTLRIDGGVNYELSHLKVRGDAIADRSLKFLKPSLTVDWKPAGGWHSQFTLRRTVAQLDFYDFISLADFKNDNVSGGNKDLEPQRAWEARLTVDRPLLKTGLVKLELGYDLVSKLQDRILVFDSGGSAFDSPGNLGTGRRAFAHLTADAPLDQIWKGLRVKFDGEVQRTRVRDPITGEPRNFSNFFPNWQWSVEARRDAGKFSYGFALSDNARTGVYRTDELDFSYLGGPFATAFVEYRLGARTSLTIEVDNLLGTHGYLERVISTPNRISPVRRISELRDRSQLQTFGLTLKQSLGGGRGVAKN